MSMSRWRCMLAALCSVFALCGCTAGKGPFLQVQMCLTDKSELSDLTAIMQSLAQSEGMKFVDRSDEATKEMEQLNKGVSGLRPFFSGRVVIMSIRRHDGLGMSAGNLDDSLVQFSVGFGEGAADPRDARKFADKAIGMFEQHWDVIPVPAERGAFPLATCKENSGDRT